MIIINNEFDIVPYLKDSGNFSGHAERVYLPETISDVITCFDIAKNDSLRITLSGSRTSLTGAAIPRGGMVISFERLNKILEINTDIGTATVQSGVVISDLNKAIEGKGYIYPPHPTETSSMIGGNIALNSSGAKSFKYGDTRKFVKKLKLALADGEVVELDRGSRIANGNVLRFNSIRGKEYHLEVDQVNMPITKNVSGYYLKENMDAVDLFIGSEGTLGVILEAEIELVPIPEKVIGSIVFFENYSTLFDFSDELYYMSKEDNRYDSPTKLSVRLIEFFDERSLKLMRKNNKLIPDKAKGAIWFEQETTFEDEESLLELIYDLVSKNSTLPDETWIALNTNEHQRIIDFRHSLPSTVFEEVALRGKNKIGTDIAVPYDRVREFFKFIDKSAFETGMDYAIWGHLGNANFHANLFPENENDMIVGREFYKKCMIKSIELGGTISAEHGIGKFKREYMRLMYSEKEIENMRSVKRYLDPDNILNVGNIFNL